MSNAPGWGQVPALPFSDRYCSTTLKATNGPAKGPNVTLGPYDSIQAWGQNANDADFNMVTGEVGYDLGKEYKLVSVTGWRHSHEYLELNAHATTLRRASQSIHHSPDCPSAVIVPFVPA